MPKKVKVRVAGTAGQSAEHKGAPASTAAPEILTEAAQNGDGLKKTGQSPKKKKKRSLRDYLALIIILVGLGVIIYPAYSTLNNARHASRAVATYDESVAKLSEEQYDEMLQAARDYNDRLFKRNGTAAPPMAGADDYMQSGSGKSESSMEDVPYPGALVGYMQLLNLNGDGMMGYLTIPTLSLKVPVYHTTEEMVLQVGAGHLANTSLPVGGANTHAVLSGHRGLPTARLFTDLDQVKVGDKVYLTMLKEKMAYEIDQVLTVLPSETEALHITEGADEITLVTCTPYGVNTHRLLIRGHRVPYVEQEVEEAEAAVPWYENIPEQYLWTGGALLLLLFLFLLWWLWRRWRKHRQKKKEQNK